MELSFGSPFHLSTCIPPDLPPLYSFSRSSYSTRSSVSTFTSTPPPLSRCAFPRALGPWAASLSSRLPSHVPPPSSQPKAWNRRLPPFYRSFPRLCDRSLIAKVRLRLPLSSDFTPYSSTSSSLLDISLPPSLSPSPPSPSPSSPPRPSPMFLLRIPRPRPAPLSFSLSPSLVRSDLRSLLSLSSLTRPPPFDTPLRTVLSRPPSFLPSFLRLLLRYLRLLRSPISRSALLQVLRLDPP